MNPKSRDDRKKYFGLCLKDNNKPAHWVVHSKLIFLDIDEFFKITQKFDGKQAIVTGNTQEEEISAKKTTEAADKNSEENERIHKDKETFVTI